MDREDMVHLQRFCLNMIKAHVKKLKLLVVFFNLRKDKNNSEISIEKRIFLT